MESNAPLSGVAVLVVEDEAVIALGVRDAIEMSGAARVDVALTLEQAEQFLSTGTYHAAVVDIRLRDGSSDGILNSLLGQGCIVVIHSGHAEEREVRESYPKAVFFPKPRPPSDLPREILAALTTAG